MAVNADPGSGDHTNDGLLRTGTCIGAFWIGEVLCGQGGAGIVYGALDTARARPVALKVFSAELSEEPDFRIRFRRVSLRLARLNHPGIARLYEAGSSEHGLYRATRLIRGPTLASLVRSGELSSARALRILAPVAAALDHLDRERMPHPDLRLDKIVVADATGQGVLTGLETPARANAQSFAATLRESLDASTPAGKDALGALPDSEELPAAPDMLRDTGPRAPARAGELLEAVCRALARSSPDP